MSNAMRFNVTLKEGLMEIGCEVHGDWPSDPLKWTPEQHFLNFISAATIAYLKTLGEVLPQHACAMRLSGDFHEGMKNGH